MAEQYLCQPLFAALANVVPALSVTVNHMAENIAMLNELEERKIGTERIMAATSLQDVLPSWSPPAVTARVPMDC